MFLKVEKNEYTPKIDLANFNKKNQSVLLGLV